MTTSEMETMKIIGEARMKKAAKTGEAPREITNFQVKENTRDIKKLSRKQYKRLAKQALELAIGNAIDISKAKLNPENEYLEEETVMTNDEIKVTIEVLQAFLEVLQKRSYI